MSNLKTFSKFYLIETHKYFYSIVLLFFWTFNRFKCNFWHNYVDNQLGGVCLMFSQQKRIIGSLLFLIVTSVLLARTVNAENLYLTGINGNDDGEYYAYIGAIFPVLGSSLGEDGSRIRVWGSYTDFEYDGSLLGGSSGVSTSFDGDGPGSEVAYGYRWSFLPNATATTYVGIAWKDIDISPDDPNSSTEDEVWGFKFQEEIDYQINQNWDVSLIASAVAGYHKAYWGRLRPGYTFSNGWKFGPEVVLIGGDVYDKQRYGVFLSDIKLGNVGITLNVGDEEESSTSDNSIYGGLSLSFVY